MILNEQQKAVIKAYGSPQVIIAGAGTGKTTVMIEKIKHLIDSKKHTADAILALTFTNKAANEMKERFGNYATGSSPFFGTFHSFCLKFLKSTPNLSSIGLKSNFTIIDGQQQKEIINDLIKIHKNPMNRKPKDILSKISKIKQNPRAMHAELLSLAATDIQAFFRPYNEKLRTLNCVDFDDLILYCHDILMLEPNECVKLNQKYEFIIVDEYQDTNQIQNDLTILLANAHQNICVVGDFDQTIYSWRGARIENLLQFNKHFPTSIIQKLEMNYRSTDQILTTANQLIEFNQQRQPKKLIANREGKNKPEHIVCFNEKEEAETITSTIKKLISQSQYKLNDFAILYRTNQQARAIEESLTQHNVPHQIIGTVAYYQRSEIKHTLAYLQCLNNINQPVWFERALLNPARGIGKTSLAKYIEFCTNNQLTLDTAINHPECPLQDRFLQIIRSFIETIKTIKESNNTIVDQFSEILESIQFAEFLKKQENAQDRLANVNELKSKLSNISDLPNFLDEVTLFQSDQSTEVIEKVNCLTLHLAKGLEFPVVFIPGFEQNIMPLKNAESIEEERRLAYVGITRGKDRVFLLSTYKRMLMGEDWFHDPSQFTKEISNTIDTKVKEQVAVLGRAILFKLDKENINYKILKSSEKPLINANKIPAKIFSKGDIVSHPKLGTGIIQTMSGHGDEIMYDINFPTGRKKLMAKYAPLTQA